MRRKGLPMMTIDWTHAWLGEVPALIARPRAAIGPLPTVLWFHGWSADKEVHRSELAQLAGAGLLAVGIDSVGHGERQPPELAQHLARSAREAQPLFDSLVAETVDEVPMLVDRLIDRGGADAERIGAAGVSMGACIVYGAIARERRLRAAVALLGSPARGRPDGSRLAVDRFFPNALLSVTAGADVVVPPAAAAALHAELTDWYRNDPDRLCHQSFPDAEHLMQETDWQQAIDSACAWLLRFLAPTGGRLE